MKDMFFYLRPTLAKWAPTITRKSISENWWLRETILAVRFGEGICWYSPWFSGVSLGAPFSGQMFP